MEIIKWLKELKPWKKILLIVDILILFSFFAYPDYEFPIMVLFTIFTVILIPWEKSSKKMGVLYGLIGIIFAIIILSLDAFFIFNWFAFPIYYYFEIVRGYQVDQLMIVIAALPLFYGLIGIFIGYFIGKKKK